MVSLFHCLNRKHGFHESLIFWWIAALQLCPFRAFSLHNIIRLCDVCMKYFTCTSLRRSGFALTHFHIVCLCYPQHVIQASTRHMLEISNVQSALRTVSAMEKVLLSVAVRRVSSGLRKILQLWLVHVSMQGKSAWYAIFTPRALTGRINAFHL